MTYNRCRYGIYIDLKTVICSKSDRECKETNIDVCLDRINDEHITKPDIDDIELVEY